MELRTLAIDPNRPALFYSWDECAKRNLFGKCKLWVLKFQHYDLTDPEVRKQLIDMGFFMKVREKPIP